MPYLTSTGTARRTGGAEQLGFGVPGYAHPLLAPTEWAELARPGTPLHWAVLNIDNGPGARPDPHCLEAAGLPATRGSGPCTARTRGTRPARRAAGCSAISIWPSATAPSGN